MADLDFNYQFYDDDSSSSEETSNYLISLDPAYISPQHFVNVETVYIFIGPISSVIIQNTLNSIEPIQTISYKMELAKFKKNLNFEIKQYLLDSSIVIFIPKCPSDSFEGIYELSKKILAKELYGKQICILDSRPNTSLSRINSCLYCLPCSKYQNPIECEILPKTDSIGGLCAALLTECEIMKLQAILYIYFHSAIEDELTSPGELRKIITEYLRIVKLNLCLSPYDASDSEALKCIQGSRNRSEELMYT